MKGEVLTRERILDAAEEVLRRFGPRKTTVVDVARTLGVSHGSVYRHVASKAELADAVTERWLHRLSAPLAQIVDAQGPADLRLRQWLEALVGTKRSRYRKDPELFAAYHGLAAEARAVVTGHVQGLVDQAARIIADGMAEGRFAEGDPRLVARAVLDATLRFHHPAHCHEWGNPTVDGAFARVVDLVVRGLSSDSLPQ